MQEKVSENLTKPYYYSIIVAHLLQSCNFEGENMTKKLISVIFAFIFAISSFSVLSVTASAANKNPNEYPYSTQEALDYAEKNKDNL